MGRYKDELKFYFESDDVTELTRQVNEMKEYFGFNVDVDIKVFHKGIIDMQK